MTFAHTRYLATVKDVFPNKIDFPTRHIGPRKTEVVAMLDLLGYKVIVIASHHIFSFVAIRNNNLKNECFSFFSH